MAKDKTATFSANITIANNLTKKGQGELIFSGTTTINAGKLIFVDYLGGCVKYNGVLYDYDGVVISGNLDVDVVELIARMTQEERNAFTQKFADRWPELAETISSCLYNEVMIKRGEI